MRRVSLLFFMFLIAPIAANADGRDVFSGVLQGVLGEIDRQQHIDAERQRRRAAALIDACFQGDERACTSALQSRLLIPDGRRAIHEQLKAIAAQRAAAERAHQTFVTDWVRCRDASDVAACEAALRYPKLLGGDRNQLLAWRQTALDRGLEAERRAAEQQAERAAQTAPAISHPASAPIVTAVIETPAAAGTPKVDPVVVGFLALSSLAALIAACLWAAPGARFMPLGSTRGGEPPPTPERAKAAMDVVDLPMTGHFPTDVRRVLAG